MKEHTFKIPNISCGHCTSAIESELSAVDGIVFVQGNIDAKTVTVRWRAPVTREKISDTLKKINYPEA